MRIQATPEWQALAAHYREVEPLHLRELLAADDGRFERYSLEAGELLLDYSRNRIVDGTPALLAALARARGLEQRIDAMFSGEAINATEGRAVLHTALRNRSDRPVYVDGEDVMPAVRGVLARMATFAAKLRDGAWHGHTGAPIRDVVNIGIGGSDLGPRMVCEALEPFGHERLRFHFVANVDATDIGETLRRVDPATTLFIVASKTFTTQETLANAHTARRWLLDSGAPESAIGRHFVALSTNAEAVAAFGIDTDNMFGFWDWVGGRYSVWSAIGLSVMPKIGADGFTDFLGGAHAMDEHFRQAPLEANLPALLGLLGVWYVNFFGAATHALLPYDQYLAQFAAYFQQGDMESNGKRVTLDGEPVGIATGPVIWGAPGTNGQHAFFQSLHQGTQLVPCDFLLGAQPHHALGTHHEMLVANCLAQSGALARGRTLEEATQQLRERGLDAAAAEALAPHRVFPGNRPSNTLLYPRLTPAVLGALIAAYEHKIFVQGALWGINSFDQWGVELGKEIATRIVATLVDGAPLPDADCATLGLVDAYRRLRER
ncbi:MAG: glucose-6-phosphate isomerase [Pseudomonadota bacterium]